MDRVITKSEFKRKHTKIVKSHKGLKLTAKILPEWGRGKWFLSNLPTPQGKILDLCGGFGCWGAYVLKVEGHNFDYTCLDKHEICKNFGPEYFHLLGLNGSFIQHDINDPLPFLDESFDQIWLFGWWVEKFDTDELFSEINRILKERGFLLLDVATLRTLGHGKPYPLCFTKERLIDGLERAGFRVLKVEGYYRSRWRREQNKFIGGVLIKPPTHSMNTTNKYIYFLQHSKK